MCAPYMCYFGGESLGSCLNGVDDMIGVEIRSIRVH